MKSVISVQHLWKEYRLGAINNGQLYRDLQSFWAKIRGKDDPWTKIGKTSTFGSGERFWALSDISLDIHKGECVAILGRNGAGKSTLLRIISRITAPTKGRVEIRGKLTSLLEVGTGFHGELTGRENIYLNGAILGMEKKEVRRKFDEIVAFSEVEKFIDTPIKRYSKGMKLRLAFSVAAHLDSEILVTDEVLAVGDVQFRQKCLAKMHELMHSEGRTLLFVSHNIKAIKRLCTSGIILENGKIVGMYDDAASLVDSYLALQGMPRKSDIGDEE